MARAQSLCRLLILLAGCGLHVACATASEDDDSTPTRARQVLEHPGFEWHSTSMPGINVHVVSPPFDQSDAEAAGYSVLEAVLELLELFQEDSFPHVDVFVLDSPERFTELVGGSATGWADVEGGVIFLLAAEEVTTPLRFELASYLAWRNWGPPYGDWLSDGVAAFGAGRCDGYEPHDWAAVLDREGRLLPLTEFEQEDPLVFGDAPVHVQVGSFVSFVFETYGYSTLRMLWAQGLEGLLLATGRTPEALEEDWLLELRDREPVEELFGHTERISCD